MRCSSVVLLASFCLICFGTSLLVIYAPEWTFFRESPTKEYYLHAYQQEIARLRQSTSHTKAYSFNEISPEIDIVYTWVNGSDPAHQKEVARYLALEGLNVLCEAPNNNADECVEGAKKRFQDNDELLYSLRSVDQHMPWARHIYIVTNGQVPVWLNVSHPKIRIVEHKDIFLFPEHLPTFNSLAIESHIHRIPGLSEHFVYFNDDMMLASPVYPTTWYNQNDGQRLWFFWPLDQHPDVPIQNHQYYDRSLRCPPCEECPPCDTEKENLKKTDPTGFGIDKPNSPYHTREVGDDEPVISSVIEKQIDAAGREGIDFVSKEWYPWDAPKMVENDDKENQKAPRKANSDKQSTGREELSRKMLAKDSVHESLLRTHKLMHEAFGYANRLVPSHVPLYIQKPIMQRLRERWPEEYYSMSSHRFRQPTDMHFPFSYSYYLMHERQPVDFKTIFQEMDSDHSAVLEPPELERLASIILLGLSKRKNVYRSPPLGTEWAQEWLKECEFSKRRRAYLFANQEELEQCFSAMAKLKEWFSLKLRNRYTLGNNNIDSKFFQVGETPELKREIQFLYLREPKFVCFNDDIDYRDDRKAAFFRGLVQNYYHTMYPNPSSFEIYSETKV